MPGWQFALQFIIDKKADVLKGVAGGFTGIGIGMASAAYSVQKLEDYKTAHKVESDLKMELINTKFKHQDSNFEDLKYGVRTINENLARASHASGVDVKLKPINYNNTPTNQKGE